jgi:hypothetical protein
MSTPTESEYLKAYKQINIASYAFFFPIIVLWIGLLLRMLISSDREKFYGLIVICILIIVSFVASIIFWQLHYTIWDKHYKQDLNHVDLASHMLQACCFTTYTAFNLAHWFFAFSYLALSYRL